MDGKVFCMATLGEEAMEKRENREIDKKRWTTPHITNLGDAVEMIAGTYIAGGGDQIPGMNTVLESP